MSKSATDIRDEMREVVREHNQHIAQRTARETLEELVHVLQLNTLRYALVRDYSREDVEALLDELAPFLTLLAEVAPTLPAKELPAAEEPAREAEAAE